MFSGSYKWKISDFCCSRYLLYSPLKLIFSLGTCLVCESEESPPQGKSINSMHKKRNKTERREAWAVLICWLQDLPMTGAYVLCLLCNPLKQGPNTLDVFFSSLNAKLFFWRGGKRLVFVRARWQDYQLYFQVWLIFPLSKRCKCLKYDSV